ncbi:SUN domain-containing protein 1-like [Dendronephthya gigantea]|uniref:SUN domain-containing protein 1-like n=1 Tax=Dendronephthya gigantea TaxID=151771 RepID=UPI00106BADBD|nr:SUN domain-containing protein 1-like [Dendronephthya gigantea]
MARRRSSVKQDSIFAEGTPEKTEDALEDSENWPRRRSRRLSGQSTDQAEELAYLQSLANKQSSSKDDNNNVVDSTNKNPEQTNEMARSYGKYEELKDTPDHLYGLDGRLASSDEDADVDVGVSFDENDNDNDFVTKIRNYVQEYWKTGFLIVLLAGVLTAALVQVYKSNDPPKNADADRSSETLRKIEEKVDRLSTVLQALANHSDSPSDNKSLLSEKAVQDIVQAALQRYNADKVGMADFALESSGAQIHDPYHSETYDVGAARVVVFGVPLWLDVKHPRVILQSDNSPGNCWAFKGQQGYVVIKLSKILTPTAFSLEHIPKLLSPTGDGRIPSAPKEFTVWAWKDPIGNERVQLGNYIFDSDGDFLQTFEVQFVKDTIAVQYVELRILSNHGNPEYTCIYRFRVHGNPHYS